MSKDRLTQLVAIAVILLALGGSMLLINPINKQRRDLQLTFAVDANQGEAPQYALLAAGLGSFRGVAVNALWYRLEMMKRDGKFAEANTLGIWISNLQPRFPHVWSFLAWNMAYNISVETYTPQERYDWVNKGIKLLREQGIPYNPNAVRLYRELGWILFHKVGQSTDDVNWYYKGEFAREWEELLGAAPEQLDGPNVIRQFSYVAEMANRYFAVSRPDLRVQAGLKEVIESGAVPQLEEPEARRKIKDLGIVALDEKLRKLRADQTAFNERGIALLDALLEATADQLSRAERDADSVFLEENPKAAAVVRGMQDAGLSLDQRGLRALGQCLMYIRFRPPEVVAGLPDNVMSPQAKAVLPLVVEAMTTPRDQGDLQSGLFDFVLPYLRAKVLIEDYNMQPVAMFRYMAGNQLPADDPEFERGYGPLDWRHPHSHSLYWAKRGVEKYSDRRDTDQVDLLNTQRLVLHSVQLLSDAGTVAFNPLYPPGQQIDLLPDTDFIDGYFTVVEETQAMAEDEKLGQRIRADAFDQGEENFLQKAVMFSYLYDDPRNAVKYFRRLGVEYKDSATNRQYGWYNLPLDTFVEMLIIDDDIGRPGLLAIINSQLTLGFQRGLIRGNERGIGIFLRHTRFALAAHAKYNEEYENETGLGVGGGRLRLPPFHQMVEDAFTKFMQDRRFILERRVNAYGASAIIQLDGAGGYTLADRTYRRWEQAVRQELVQSGFSNPDLAIPAPPNVVENAEGVGQEQGGTTIQRQ